MKINGVPYRSITLVDDQASAIKVIDQRLLPWELKFVELSTCDQAAIAIRDMWVRGAPLLSLTGAYGVVFALRADPNDAALNAAYQKLLATRPTAVNLRWALDQMMDVLKSLPPSQRLAAAIKCAGDMCDEDVELNMAIGRYGLGIIKALQQKNPDRPVQIMTHCNPGWLATIDYGTAPAGMFMAHDVGLPIHVWVSETRPRNQGAALTAYELQQHGVPHTVIVDSAAGLLMQRGQVDMVIVGADRVALNGDTCNKVGTYLKALAARAHNVPFYVALPYTTFDPRTATGAMIEIENRSENEVIWMSGQQENGQVTSVRVTASHALNPAFDITPAELITGYVTERGVLTKEQLQPKIAA